MPVVLIAGTRPEVIKLAPVYKQMKKLGMDVHWVFTGQQKDIALQTFDALGMKPEYNFRLERETGSLHELFWMLGREMEVVLDQIRPDMVVVQGDTLSACVGAQTAWLSQTLVAHVEAGLRSWDIQSPFPEEASRIWIDAVADLRFAPTQQAAMTLPPGKTWITGNTEIDALRLVKRKRLRSGDYAVVTLHRRENAESVEEVCEAVRELAESKMFSTIVWPVHPNPTVRNVVPRHLIDCPKVELVEPLPYDQMVNLLRHAKLVLTDSGGIQEQCLGLGVPGLVLRNETERPEGVQTGGLKIVGANREKIVGWTKWLMENPEEWENMASAPNPYGDGRAAERIALVCKAELEGREVHEKIANWKGVGAA